jgi:hypothetical protein
VRNERLDILATNPLGHALHSKLYPRPAPPGEPRPVRLPRPRARDFWVDWQRAADDTVGILHAWQDVTHTTSMSMTSSASCLLAAKSSAIGGPATTSTCTAAAPSASSTTSSGAWS